MDLAFKQDQIPHPRIVNPESRNLGTAFYRAKKVTAVKRDLTAK